MRQQIRTSGQMNPDCAGKFRAVTLLHWPPQCSLAACWFSRRPVVGSVSDAVPAMETACFDTLLELRFACSRPTSGTGGVLSGRSFTVVAARGDASCGTFAVCRSLITGAAFRRQQAGRLRPNPIPTMMLAQHTQLLTRPRNQLNIQPTEYRAIKERSS